MEKQQLFYEEVTNRCGGIVIASNIHPATDKEIRDAQRLYQSGKCPHTIIRDTEGWPYDIRHCVTCGENLGIV